VVAYDVTVGSVTQTLTVSRSDPAGTRYVQSIQSAAIPNGNPVTFSVQSRNDFAGTSPQWNRASGSNTPAGAPIAQGSPTADANRESGTSVTVDWSGVFSGNGAALQRYYVALTADGSLPSCRVDGVDGGTPELRVSDPQGEFVNTGTATRHEFTGLTPNADYRAIVYAYNGQGCTASAVVAATPRQRPGEPSVTLSAPTKAQDGLYTVRASNPRYASGGGGASVRWQFEVSAGDRSVVRELPGGEGEILPPDGRTNYAMTLRIRVCETIGQDELCSDWTAQQDIGYTVDLRLDGLRYDVLSATYSWTGAALVDGQQSGALRFSCDDHATWTEVAPQGGECTNPEPLSWRGIIVQATLNGKTYAEQW
jgi:hypothetical protein